MPRNWVAFQANSLPVVWARLGQHRFRVLIDTGAARSLAAPSKLRGAITPIPRQPGIEAQVSPASSRLGWARLLKRVFSIDLERCPRCPLGAWRLLAAIPSRPLIRRLLRHLQLAADPPPIVAARVAQRRFAWASP
jgi:hypothetical protein